MQNMKVAELKALAKEKGFSGYSKLNKAQLIELLKEPEMDERFLGTLPEEVEVIQYKDDDEWKEFRKLGVGGSDVAGILGESNYKSPIDVFIDKTQGSDFKGNEATEWGIRLEPVLATKFQETHPEFEARELGVTLKKGKSLANIDRLIYHPEKGYGVLECKTTSAFNKDAWEGDKPPQEYYCQVMHYLAVAGLKYAYMNCLVGGQKYKEFYIEREDDECEFILGYVEDWWKNYVEPQVPPPADGSDAYSKYQNSKIDKLEDSILEINDDDNLIEYDVICENIKSLEKEKKKIQQEWIDKMIASKSNKARIGEHKISAQIQIRESVDKDKLKIEIPNFEKFIKVKKIEFYKVM